MKTYLITTLVLLSSIAAYAEDKFGRNVPEQQFIRATEDGQLEMLVLTCTCRPVTMRETYTVKVPVEENGKQVFKTEEKLREVSKFVTETHLYAAPLDLNNVKAFETDGRAVDVKTLAQRVKKPTLVVLANDGKMIAPYYAAVFKPGTLIIAPQNGGLSPLPPIPSNSSTLLSPVTGTPLKLVSQEEEKPAAPQPTAPPTDVPPTNTPPVDLGLGGKLPYSLPPTMLFARVPEAGKINLRRYSESLGEREISLEIKKQGTPETVLMKQLQKFTRSEAIQLNLSDVQATTADAKSLNAQGLSEKLKTATVVLVASMGQPVDSFWLTNVKPGVVVLVPPQGVAFGAAAYVAMPGPISNGPEAVPQPAQPGPAPAPAVLAPKTSSVPSPFPPDVTSAWKKAGAEVGELVVAPWVYPIFTSLEMLAEHGLPPESPVGTETISQLPGPLPAFKISSWKPGIVGKLPAPMIPFALDLCDCGSPDGKLVGDAGLKELKGLKQLQTLHIAGAKVTDLGLKELAALPNLRTIDISFNQITDAGLKELAALSKLQVLSAGHNETVTGTGFKDLAGLKDLKTLNLMGAKGAGDGLKELAAFPNLEWLNLSETGATDVSMTGLKGLAKLQTLNLVMTKITDVGLQELAGLKNLQILELFNVAVTDDGMKPIGGLTSLKTLGLGMTKITDAGLKELAALKELESLNLHKSAITDAGLQDLAGLENLKSLTLRETAVSDAGLKSLAGLTHLTDLSLGQTQVKGEGLKDLSALKELTKLDLDGTSITDAGLAGVSALEKLENLQLGATPVTDAGLKELSKLSNLHELNLYQTKVTDAGIMELAGLKKLKVLQLGNTQVTEEGRKKLRAALPECQIN